MKKQIILILVLFLFSNIYSQEVVKKNKQHKETMGSKRINSPQANGDKIIVKDNVGNALIEINDEGTFGSITLPDSAAAPAVITNKLYNVGGTLNFNGTALGASVASQINDLSDAKFDGESLFLGEGAGLNDDAGASDGFKNKNTAVGYRALYSNITGISNTANGLHALYSNTTGNYNTANGYQALYYNTTGNYNIGIGSNSNYFNEQGSKNTIVGYQAGLGTALHNKSGNIFLGYKAGYFETGNDKLYIQNDSSTTPLIGGDFAAKKVYLNGMVGIGTSTPTSNLQVFGSNNWSYSVGNGWGDFNIGNGTYGLATGVAINGGGAGDVRIWTKGGTERLIFTNPTNGDLMTLSNNKVGIGTTNPLYKLHVQDNGGGQEVAFFYNTDKGIDSDGIIVRAGPDVNPGGGVDYVIFDAGDGTPIGSIDGNGSGGVRYNTTSDVRLKTKIRDFTGAVKKIDLIQVRKYERKTNPGVDEIGFIAQELQKVYPQAVSGSPDNDVETDPMMVDYGRLTPLLVRAIQELQEENDKIRAHDAGLRNEITQIKTKFEQNEIVLKQVLNYLKIDKEDLNLKVSKK